MIKIVYTGTIYEGKEKPEVLFQALRELLDEGKTNNSDCQVNIYWDIEPWIDKEIGRYGLAEIVKQCGKVDYKRAVELQGDADILWLIKWDQIVVGCGWADKFLAWIFRDKNYLEFIRENKGRLETGVTPLKFFEYMGRKRPILATGGCEDEVSKIIAETNCGADCLTVEDVKEFLVECLKIYQGRE